MSTFTPLKKSSLSCSILTKREKKIEGFIYKVVNDARLSEASLHGGNYSNYNMTSSSNNPNPNTCSKRVLDAAQETLLQHSLLMSHKYGPIVTQHFSNQMQMEVAADYATIVLPATDMHTMALLYQEAINTWLDSDKISFQTTDVQLAGKLSLKDCFVLHFFSFLCCYRCEADNCFVLAVTGCSTSGKTVLFENPIMRNAHSFVGEVGVGRYTVGSKSLLLYSDIAVEKLLKGNDGEKFKTLARTERTTCKIHSHTEEVPPVFLFVTSNQNFHRHSFSPRTAPPAEGDDAASTTSIAAAAAAGSKPSKQTAFLFQRGGGGPRVFPSSMDTLFGAQKARTMEPLVLAIKNRVLEAFVSSPPAGLVLPTSSKFQRIHAVLGLYVRVFNLLSEHNLEDFHSVALPSYVLTGLIDNARAMHELLNGEVDSNSTSAPSASPSSPSPSSAAPSPSSLPPSAAASSASESSSPSLSSMVHLLRALIDKYFSSDPHTHALFVNRLDSKTKFTVSTATSTSTSPPSPS